MSRLDRLVSTLQKRFSQLETDFNHAFWDSQIEATPENEARRARLELEVSKAKGDRDAFARVVDALGQEVHDPLLRRELEVLRLMMAGNQMSDEYRELIVKIASSVETDFSAYRPEVDGRRLSDNEIEEVLRKSDDVELRTSAWEASKEVGFLVADRLRELARLRNAVARDLGYADYYQMALDLQELSEEWLFSVMSELESLTEKPFRRWKEELDAKLKERFATDALRPWHYADPFFQSLPPDGAVSLDEFLEDASAADLAARTFDAWGTDVSAVLERSDLLPREKKNQHAFCIDIDRTGHDVRILANVVPGEKWVEVILHESGHAAYDAEVGAELPYLLHRPAHIFVTEAIAILSGRLVRDPRWLIDIARISSGDVDAIASELITATATQSLLFARWGLVMVHFERALYADPESDLDARWWELVERFQSVSPPPGRKASDWAAKIHFAVAPVYYHNYLLGEMLASQLHAACEKECGGLVGSKSAGKLLRERIFRHGARLRWDELIEQATGAPLTASDFAAYLGRTPT